MVYLEKGDAVEPKLKNYFPKTYKKSYFFKDIEDESATDQ